MCHSTEMPFAAMSGARSVQFKLQKAADSRHRRRELYFMHTHTRTHSILPCTSVYNMTIKYNKHVPDVHWFCWVWRSLTSRISCKRCYGFNMHRLSHDGMKREIGGKSCMYSSKRSNSWVSGKFSFITTQWVKLKIVKAVKVADWFFL